MDLLLPRAKKSSLLPELDCNVPVHGKGCVLPKISSYGLICVVGVVKMSINKINLL